MFVRSQGRCIVLILTWGSLCRQPEVRTRRDRPSQMRFLAQAPHQWKSSFCMAQASPEESHARFLHDSCSYILCVIWSYPAGSYGWSWVFLCFSCPRLGHVLKITFQIFSKPLALTFQQMQRMRRMSDDTCTPWSVLEPLGIRTGCIRFPFSLICLERALDDHDIWLSMCKRGVTLHGRSGGGWRQVCKGCWIRWEELWCFFEFLQSWWLQLRWFDHVWLQ